MALSKRAYVVILGAGLGGIILMAMASKANAATVKKPGAIPPKPGGDIKVEPPGPSGLPDGTVAPVTVETDEHGNVTGVTVEDDPSKRPGYDSGVSTPINPSGVPSQGTTPGNVTTIPGPPAGGGKLDITNAPPAPIAAQEVQPENDPNGTVMLARVLLARETAPGWKKDLMPEVKLWQSQVGLKPDGQFGMKSLERMAEEVAILPIVRFWSSPVFHKASAVKEYRNIVARAIAKLTSKLPMSEYHIAALKAGVAQGREKGQSLDRDPKPVSTLAEVEAMFKNYLDPKALSDAGKAIS